jgi:GWxTD domain-containing protein
MQRLGIALTLILGLAVLTGGKPEYKVSRADIESLSPGMQETFAGLQYLLNPYQMRHFLSLGSEKQRIRWIELFWKQRDPTPTTDENEMEREHNIRVKLARQFYRSKKWPGWDKRGEVFIRYGPPDYRGKMWGEVTVNRGMSPPREIWYYRGHNMVIAFENFGLTGEYIYAIDPLGSVARMSPEFAEFLVYETNESIGSKIPPQYLEYFAAAPYAPPPDFVNPQQVGEFLAGRERVVADDIDAVMDPDRVEMLPKDVGAIFQREQADKIANNFEITLEETPSSYPFNFEQKALPFYFGVDQFKAGDETNRVDVNIEVPVSGSSGSTAFEETYHAEIVVWNSEYEELNRKEKNIVVRSAPDVASFANLLPTQIPLSLQGGYYRVGIRVRGEKSGRSSSYRTTFECDPFGGRFSISDIVFARRIVEATRPSIFTRGALEVVPHPLRAYSLTFPVPIYFEIYNLTPDLQGVASYSIEYKVVPHSARKQNFFDRFGQSSPVVSSSFKSSSLGRDDVQHITLNVQNLRKGSYDLLVTVTDDYSGVVAYRKGTFSLVE